eukprot:10107080-Alexandrium_andersonii.AAC.1
MKLTSPHAGQPTTFPAAGSRTCPRHSLRRLGPRRLPGPAGGPSPRRARWRWRRPPTPPSAGRRSQRAGEPASHCPPARQSESRRQRDAGACAPSSLRREASEWARRNSFRARAATANDHAAVAARPRAGAQADGHDARQGRQAQGRLTTRG